MGFSLNRSGREEAGFFPSFLSIYLAKNRPKESQDLKSAMFKYSGKLPFCQCFQLQNPFLNSLPNLGHELEIKTDVDQCGQAVTQHFLHIKKMMKIAVSVA